MTTSNPRLALLDVGHGNAAVLTDGSHVVVIDAGSSGIVLDYLRQINVTMVSAMLLSHADADHIKCAPDILLEPNIKVGSLYYNSDASKSTAAWENVSKAIKIARRTKSLIATPHLTSSLTGSLTFGSTSIQILYPHPEDATSAPGGRNANGRLMTSNSMCAALRLVRNGTPVAVLAGDIETDCLKAWVDEGCDVRAPILVFPHHGGLPGGGNVDDFCSEICRLVQPSLVVFSIHRSLFSLPKPEVMKAVRMAVPEARIMCTQLSSHCTASVSQGRHMTHLTGLPALGLARGHCCAGSLVIELDSTTHLPGAVSHGNFIQTVATNALCR